MGVRFAGGRATGLSLGHETIGSTSDSEAWELAHAASFRGEGVESDSHGCVTDIRAVLNATDSSAARPAGSARFWRPRGDGAARDLTMERAP
jgi:hypothetical protein